MRYAESQRMYFSICALFRSTPRTAAIDFNFRDGLKVMKISQVMRHFSMELFFNILEVPASIIRDSCG
jgi:hypothetical protein